MDENKIIKEFTNVLLREKKIDRYIGLAKVVVFLVPFLLVLYLNVTNKNKVQGLDNDKPYVAAVMINGSISEGTPADSLHIVNYLEDAFADKNAVGVAIIISSPGGTPVNSTSIYTRIVDLRKEYPDKKVVAIGRTLMTSGAMLVAAGAPKIYASESTVVGSIGVVLRTYGFVDLIDKLGIERRVLHAGTNKNTLDPFLELKDEDIEKMNKLLSQTHEQFKNIIIESRGDRLNASHDVLFNADVWNGNDAKELGLIDGVGDYNRVLVKEFGTLQMRIYGNRKTALEVLTGRSVSQLVTWFGEGIANAIIKTKTPVLE